MKINLLLIAIFFSIIIYADINYETGIIGATKLNGEGCICHDLDYNDSIYVWIEGPDSIFISDTVAYKIFLSGGPAVNGGFNVAVRLGALESVDTTTYINFDELTHSFSLGFTGDTVSWNFKYIAADTSGTDTIYSVANSVNGDGNPIVGDKWNFGENFAVQILNIPVSVENETLPQEFYLAQNYPNPFNPSTKIRFTILKVYDVLGSEVATLVDEFKPAGNYQVEFNPASGIENPASGIYFYQLQASSPKGQAFIQTKKMVYLK